LLSVDFYNFTKYIDKSTISRQVV